MRTTVNRYETEHYLRLYLLSHYGTNTEQMPFSFGPRSGIHFPERCVECFDFSELPPNSIALDLGCSVGRASFELARHCQKVIGVDASEQFIEVASVLRDLGEYPYQYHEEGFIKESAVAKVSHTVDRSRVEFYAGDVSKLKDILPQHIKFDFILAANLLCRLASPREFLLQIPHLLRPGGQFVLASPYSWAEEFTPVTKWLGGFEYKDEPVYSVDAINTLLSEQLHLEKTVELPYILREHRRSFQWGVAHTTCWRK